MSIIYRCTLELHDSLHFATREIGRLYETEPVLHNYALTYALGLVDSDRYATSVSEENAYCYFCAEQVPKYRQHLNPTQSTRNLCHTSKSNQLCKYPEHLEVCQQQLPC